jgi:SPP1 gp7 family putative phage head morphogenesis protein
MNAVEFYETRIAEIAKDTATRVLVELCRDSAITRISALAFEAVLKQELEEQNPTLHAELFDAIFKAIAPHERKFRQMLRGIWAEERAIVLANIRKLRKAYLAKDEGDTADSLLYPKLRFTRKVADQSSEIGVALLTEQGQQALDRVTLDVSFNIENPAVKKWVETYYPRFSENLETVNVFKLREALIEGLKAGEGIPELMNRVNDLFDQWDMRRAELIARTETLRASNRGSLEGYRQSGVVEKLVWITFFDERTCPWCEDMDGTVVGIDDGFFDQGDEYTIADKEGEDHTMTLDYEAVESPPLHPDCRCTLAPYFE